MAGLVTVAGRPSDKAGTAVSAEVAITVKERPRFVSRGGNKLAGALGDLAVIVEGVSGLDVGASTGGFVDCLLQCGATRVIALDVGRGQLDARLRQDARVHVMEKVNARYLQPEDLPYRPDFLTMDVSFISVSKVLPSAVACLSPEFEGLVLIKPQFEAGPREVGKGGIVSDPDTRRKVLREAGGFVIEQLDAHLLGLCRSRQPGTGGNVEFFFHVGRGGGNGVGLDRLEELINEPGLVEDAIHGGRAGES
jgi:23S rRNA (cytidine1920-2'-O)/16S rRNA (cytidine1409-2'-O)-methyltransferase